MTVNVNIPSPIRFNAFKHHRNYILGLLGSATPELIASLVETVNNNYVDIYYGAMTPEAISYAVIDILKSKKVLQEEAFTPWVETNKGFRHLTLEDQSEWIVRRSVEDEKEQYIHLHPARTGPFSIRYKGSTLKTVYLLKANSRVAKATPSLELVNRLRSLAGLSPVKDMRRINAIINCYEEFFAPDYKSLR